MSTLLGQPTGHASTRCWPGPRQIPKAPAKVAVGVPAEMLRRRPDIRSAELQRRRAVRPHRRRQGRALSQLLALGHDRAAARQHAAPAVRTTSSRPAASSIPSGPRINWPFLNYGRLTNSVRVEDARFQQLLVDYRDTVLKAAQEVEDALAGFLNAQEADGVRAERRRRPRSGRCELALVQYREGAVDYQRVLDAQRSLLQQQNSLAADELVGRHQPDRALQGAGRRLGAARRASRSCRTQTQREMKERTNWGDMLSQPRAPETERTRHRGSNRESAMAKKPSKRALEVDRRGRRRRDRRVHRRSRTGQAAERAARGDRRRATAASRAKLVDVAAKEPLRVKEILVDEGALVKPGQVLVQLDTVTLEAQLAEANAERRRPREEQLAVAKASIVKQKSEIELAEIEVERARKRWSQQGAGSQRELDVRTTKLETTKAGARARQRRCCRPPSSRSRSRGRTRRRSRPASTTRRCSRPSPGGCSIAWPSRARCSAPGGKALTLVNLEDVYMEIFLPVGAGGRREDRRRGAHHRRLRARTARSPGTSASSRPEAQFTPKQVETKSEREKLMFRVKIQVPKELVGQYIERIKTGVRGVGYVKVKDSAVWPARLQNLVHAPGGRLAAE